jgi:hypothetical protein
MSRAPHELKGKAPFCSRPCYWDAMRSKPIEERFWTKVDKNGPMPEHCPELGPCWLWTGAKTTAGYGYIHLADGSKDYAHRISSKIHGGRDATGLSLCHRCDNPPCVNPAHLFVGTQVDNMRDMWSKGRATQQKQRDGSSERHRAIPVSQT